MHLYISQLLAHKNRSQRAGLKAGGGRVTCSSSCPDRWPLIVGRWPRIRTMPGCSNITDFALPGCESPGIDGTSCYNSYDRALFIVTIDAVSRTSHGFSGHPGNPNILYTCYIHQVRLLILYSKNRSSISPMPHGIKYTGPNPNYTLHNTHCTLHITQWDVCDALGLSSASTIMAGVLL